MSGIPPTRVATTGAPTASAWITVVGRASARLVMQDQVGCGEDGRHVVAVAQEADPVPQDGIGVHPGLEGGPELAVTGQSHDRAQLSG